MKNIFSIIGLTALYIVVAKLSLLFAVVNPSASPIWPPTGLAIALILILGTKFWPAIFLGAFLTNVTTAGTIFSSLGIALGNTLEAIIAVSLVKRYAHGTLAFDHPKDIVVFAIVAGVAGTIAAASIGVTSLAIVGSVPWDQFFSVWFTWWMGDMGGAWVVTPALILWYTHPHISKHGLHLSELALFCIVTFGMGAIIFSGFLPYPYLIVPILLWGAIRLQPKETSLAMIILACVAIWYTSKGMGPYAIDGVVTNQSMLLLQMYIGIMTLTELIVAAVVRERSMAQSTISNLEHRFQALIEKNSDVINLIDAQSNLLYISPSVYAVLGYKPEELVGTVGFSLVHPDDIKNATETLGRIAAAPNAAASTQIRLHRKDGTWVWVETIGTNLLGDPAVNAIVVNYRDITQRKDLEQSKDEFLMIAAHQLRTPLTAIRWNMELIRQKMQTIPKTIQEKLNHVYEQNLKMIGLVNELLGVSRIISGTTPNKPTQTDINALVQKEVDATSPMAKAANISVTFKKQKDIPTYMIDNTKMTDVLQNVLSNAIKYGVPNGTIAITTSLDQANLIIRVADSGIGIPKDEQSKLGDKFFRASNAMAKNSEGSGLGLFIVQSYMKDIGGTLHIESPTHDDGTGTTARLVIPITHIQTQNKK